MPLSLLCSSDCMEDAFPFLTYICCQRPNTQATSMRELTVSSRRLSTALWALAAGESPGTQPPSNDCSSACRMRCSSFVMVFRLIFSPLEAPKFRFPRRELVKKLFFGL